MSTDFFTAAERAALDSVSVPRMRSGLAAAIVSSASAGATVPTRRDARGGWRRHGGLLLGAGALVLASATAAATGLLGQLPIAIPGITHVVEAPKPKPKAVVRAPKAREPEGKPVALASAPVVEATPVPPTPGERWRAQREARIAAGLPVRRPMIQRAIAEKLRAIPPEARKAAMDEWRRIKALPPEERKIAIAKVRADYLANHPRMAERYQQRLEARAARAASGGDPQPQPGALPPANAQPQARPQLTPEERADRRQRWQEWRARRAQRLQNQQ